MVRFIRSQGFAGTRMSSTDLNNEDYFSDHPKRLPSFDDLFRAQAQLTPERFFRNLERQSGDISLQPGRFPESGIFVPATAISAADNFTFDSLSGCRLGRAVRLSGAS